MTISDAEKIFSGKLEFSNLLHLEARNLLRLKEQYLELRERYQLGPSPDGWWVKGDLEMEIEDIEYQVELRFPPDYVRQREACENPSKQVGEQS